jgi:hypothetical protein
MPLKQLVALVWTDFTNIFPKKILYQKSLKLAAANNIRTIALRLACFS